MSATPWTKSHPPPARWDVAIHTGPVCGALDDAAERFDDRPAVDTLPTSPIGKILETTLHDEEAENRDARIVRA